MREPDDRRVLLAHRAASRALRRFRGLPAAVRQELAQEAALRTWAARDVRDWAAFARQVARHLATDCLRRERPSAGLDVELEEAVPFARRLEARSQLRRLAWALRRSHHWPTVWAFAWEERTVAELTAGGDTRDLWYKRRRRAQVFARALAEV